MRVHYLFPLVLFCLFSFGLSAQTLDTFPVFDYSKPQEYEIGGIKVTGAQYSDENAVKAIAGLRVGDKIKIPGDDIPNAVQSLWRLRLFTNVQIYQEKTIGEIIFLEIVLEERPRLSRFSYKGVRKSLHDDLNDQVNKHLLKGGIVTENVKTNAANEVKEYFRGKGYLDVAVEVDETTDEIATNSVRLTFNVDRNSRVKVQDIVFKGNESIKGSKLRGKMKNTRRKRKFLSTSKFIKDDYEEDKKKIIAYYNNQGFRDARIESDSLWRTDNGHLAIQLNIDEGNKYYFRNISWKGNSIYPTETLDQVLGIMKGDVYNQELLETRLQFSMDGRDVSTLYMDNGYLFFNVDPVEVAVLEDSIDLEIRIFEGPQATIDKVTIKGNDRTHEHVIRRELRTRPGQKFSRSDIIRSQREIINLGYFNPESMEINTPVNPQRGTVDIEYILEEKPSDQLELSAGWGGRGRGVIGTLGVSFNNFSLRNILKKEAWSPLPQGDGQRLSLRAQTNGRFFQSYNASFTEPWLGGKRPTSFTVGGFYSEFTNGADRDSENFSKLGIGGGSIGLGTRLKFPDDNFISNTTLNLQNISLDSWFSGGFVTEDGQLVTEGSYNNFSIKQTIARNSVVDPIFPKKGSLVSLTIQLTPPYSLFTKDKDYASLSTADRFRWLEYHKWRIDYDWYAPIVGNLVLKASAKIGMLGFYNREIGLSPFEQFQLGGDGLANQAVGITGLDIISLRGYDVNEINQGRPAAVFDKFTVELRYPLSLNPSATIYMLAFAQGGNAWNSFRDFNPFDVRRSAGFGLRVFLPMFGTLGFDYGIGFDKPNLVGTDAKWTDYGRFNIILGFEPE
jgi:outer membrane protein insertion porin family